MLMVVAFRTMAVDVAVVAVAEVEADLVPIYLGSVVFVVVRNS